VFVTARSAAAMTEEEPRLIPLQVESVDEIVRDVRQALRFIPAENLILSSDCGFGRQGPSRLVAFHKAEALAQAAAIVRAELP
jgi:5-methyltetrahydropteroyltriglutamate--homocysteine methyltransferase